MEVIDELNHLVSQEQIDKERLGVIAENQERLTDEIQELQEKLQREEENQKSLLEGSRQTEERFAAGQNSTGGKSGAL